MFASSSHLVKLFNGFALKFGVDCSSPFFSFDLIEMFDDFFMTSFSFGSDLGHGKEIIYHGQI
jgi:hypothetical protein